MTNIEILNYPVDIMPSSCGQPIETRNESVPNQKVFTSQWNHTSPYFGIHYYDWDTSNGLFAPILSVENLMRYLWTPLFQTTYYSWTSHRWFHLLPPPSSTFFWDDHRKYLRKWNMDTHCSQETQTLVDSAARQLLKRLGECTNMWSSKRSYCLGIRETMRAIKKSTIQLVLIANYVENTDKMKKLESKIAEMIAICKQHHIPYHFVLDVYEMAHCLGLHSKVLRKISVMGMIVVPEWNVAHLNNVTFPQQQQRNHTMMQSKKNNSGQNHSMMDNQEMETNGCLSAQVLPFLHCTQPTCPHSSSTTYLIYFGDVPISIPIPNNYRVCV
ncbi:hypothetical protein GpartN1_g7427.t1 [Galdieria partita]|uniref:Ribosomal protein eL8/eL30/eS12/Gadd45 domain-containing protein n=1 Tax=Galdieria partita TaxID=83374 RepID=A0A9C7Q3N9_9RHOD|nr:hypothetical protein GpartN1_g7427.t1 [Galdieria partita]